MFFVIIFVLRAFEDNNPRWIEGIWFADNEGDLPDAKAIFAAANGYEPSPLNDYLPRSLSVGDSFFIIPVTDLQDFRDEYQHGAYHTSDIAYEAQVPMYTVTDFGFTKVCANDYWSMDGTCTC